MGAQLTPTTMEDYLRQQSRAQRQTGRLPRGGVATYGTVDPNWLSGLPSVIIDGESFARQPGFPWDPGPAGTWTPSQGQRVWLAPSVSGYTIGGPIVESRNLLNRLPLPLGPGIGTYSNGVSSAWAEPYVTKTADGIVYVGGLAIAGSVAVAAGSVIGTLPVGFRPDADGAINVNGMAIAPTENGVTYDVYPDGRIVTPVAISPTGYIGLNFAFPAAGVATWTPVSDQATTDPVRFGSTWRNRAVAGYVPCGYWVDSYNVVWWRGMAESTAASHVDNDPIVITPQTLLPTHYSHFTSSQNPTAWAIIGASGSISTVAPNAAPFGLKFKVSPTAYAALQAYSLNSIVYKTAASPLVLQQPALIPNWLDYDTTAYSPHGFVNRNGLMIFQGLIKAGTLGNSAWQQPVGARIKGYHGDVASSNTGLLFSRPTSGGRGRFDIYNATGNVIPTQGGTAWFSMDGAMAPAEW